MIIKKVPTHIFSLINLAINTKNPASIFRALRNKKTKIILKDPYLEFYIDQVIDLLILHDNVLNDEYQIKKLTAPKYIIDIGAGFGDTSLYTASLWPKAEIISFEPNPISYNLLKQNINTNKIANIKAYNFAVGQKDKYQLYIPKTNSRSSLVYNKKSQKSISVGAIKLAKYIYKPVDLLKIDCEGAEIEVLKTIKKDQFNNIQKIIIEYHNHIIKNQDKKLTQILKNYNYTISQNIDSLDLNIGLIFANKL